MALLQEFPELVQFLETQKTATVGMPVSPDDIHCATMVCWCRTEPGKPVAFFFVTSRDSEKCRLVKQGSDVRGACNIGTVYGVNMTVQMRGLFAIVDPDQHAAELDAYYKKRGNMNDHISEPGNILLRFTPDWMRCTDYTDGRKMFFVDL